MGALRVNLTNGTTTFINLGPEYNEVLIEEATTTYTTIRANGPNSDVWALFRYQTSPKCIWEGQMDVAYTAIAAIPIEYGYPNLGSDKNQYIKYDASKFGVSALQQALSGQVEDEIPYTERTAIAENVTSVDEAEKMVAELETARKDIEQETKSLAAKCSDQISDGNTFTWPNGVVCSTPECCEVTKDEYIAEQLIPLVKNVVGPISWKHQYLWENVQSGGPN